MPLFRLSRKKPAEPDPAEALLREVGARLRQVRMERGEELEDVAQYLRIRPTYLHGLEQGDLSVVPGRTYALGFLRSYAQYLGFDGDDLIAQIRSSGSDLTGRPRLHVRSPLPESRLPKTPILVLSLAALAGIYAGWAYVEYSSRAVVEVVAEVPEELQQLVRDAQPEPVVPARHEPGEVEPGEADEAAPAAEVASADEAQPAVATDEPDLPAEPLEEVPAAEVASAVAAEGEVSASQVAQVAEPPAALPPAVQVETEQAAIAAVGPVAEPPAEPQAEPEAGPEAGPDLPSAAEILAGLGPVAAGATPPAIFGDTAANPRVILRARSSSWVHVSSPDGDYVWIETLEPGDAFIVPERPDLMLWTGNAGGIEVIVDGAPLAPLGPDAGVVRDVSLRPEALLGRLLPAPAAGAAPGL